MLDAVSGLGSGSKGLLSSLNDFFHSPDNLLALAICLVSVVGIYRLLRAEHIIPAPSRPSMGGMLASPLARSMVVRAMFAIVLAALGLAVAFGRLTGLLDLVKNLF
ncbi:hypothetical protein DVDV_3257 [Desulfovibrio sp. DV]|uniref:hypothetical protein n=1 Tax=Desulfovibrio sp. DV TaxID=1844708 RepID=UPI000967B62D|nr:hypothetical protein [Desulfovibrio sp. DV]OLN25558.1 hypothetical protein DVDV_3257 [Desulfovibrio sp. DV]